MRVFIADKVTGCRPLALLKLTLLQVCFKELCKNYFIVFWEMVNKCADPSWTSGVLLQYHSGLDKARNLYKGIIAFMVVWLKPCTIFAFQAIPQAGQSNIDATFNGQWQAEKISDNIDSLIEIGISVRGIVTDNHSANVNAFTALKNIQFRIKLYKVSAKQ